jgi:hypothetical protein
MGGIAVLLIVFVMRDPVREEIEFDPFQLKPTTWCNDFRKLLKK